VFAGYQIEGVLNEELSADADVRARFIREAACRFDAANQAVDIVNGIAAKIPQ
jgi:hypothetical protein